MVIGPSFVYIGIPRTATNTMSRLFLPQFGGVDDGRPHNRIVPAEHRHKFTLTVVRNPYDRLLSAWHHNRHHGGLTLDFPAFVEKLMTDWDASGKSQVEFLAGIRIDCHLRYESLADDVLDWLPFNADKPFPRERINSEDRPCWRDELTREGIDAVNRHSCRDFIEFGYSPVFAT